MIQRKTSLSENVIAFCRFLRGHAFTVGVQEEALALEALGVISFEEKDNFKDAVILDKFPITDNEKGCCGWFKIIIEDDGK